MKNKKSKEIRVAINGMLVSGALLAGMIIGLLLAGDLSW